jgi:hypothetical protein
MGIIKPNESKEFILNLFAVRCGFIPISGIIVKDLTSKRVTLQT